MINQYPKIATWLNMVKQRASLRETMGEDFTKHFIELLEKHNLIA
jgi:DNA-directed RNA polymerase sigma subunit (sigma70/sigma32)